MVQQNPRRRERRLARVGPDGETAKLQGQLPRVAWYHGSARNHSKGDGPSLDLTQFQPSTPGGYLGGNALGGFW